MTSIVEPEVGVLSVTMVVFIGCDCAGHVPCIPEGEAKWKQGKVPVQLKTRVGALAGFAVRKLRSAPVAVPWL